MLVANWVANQREVINSLQEFGCRQALKASEITIMDVHNVQINMIYFSFCQNLM